MESLASAATQILRFSAMLVLLGAVTTAQTGTVQAPISTSRIAPSVSPVSPGSGVRGPGTSGASGGNSDGAYPTQTNTSAPSVIASPTGMGAQSSELLIGSGDLLEVSVFGAPDYIKQVRVSSTGEVTLPLAGPLKIGGMTIAQAETLIAARLSDGGFFNEPKVSVLEKEFATQGISVLGEVQKPGIYPLPGTRNLYDVLSAAGGTTARAGVIVSLTHRNDPLHRSIVTLSYDGKGSDQANIPVYPGDTVVVSKAGVVYVVGDVHLPGGFTMENAHMTILQAVAMAQGANPTAALDSAKLIRNAGQGSKPEEIPISLKKILSAKADDVTLQPNDIVFIPNSAAKTAGRRTLDAIVQAATGMAIYGRL